jgi:hypothetical protein
MSPMRWIALAILAACGEEKGGMVVDPPDEDRDTGEVIEVGGAELVSISGGAVVLGEGDELIVYRYGGDGSEAQTIIPTHNATLESYWIDRYPFPGVPDIPWFTDGLSQDMVAWLDEWMADYGRRACTVSELLYAAAGPVNDRYPYGDGSFDPNACDPDDTAPAAIGTHAGCESALGIRDFQVRSAWGRLDSQMVAVMADTPQATGFPLDNEFAAWGGTSRSDTYYAPSNFGFHLHGWEDDPYQDDGFRVCAGPDKPTPEQDAAYSYWLEDVVRAGSYVDLFE